MKMMRAFVTDIRLHKILDEVESWMGYAIPAAPMPLQIQEGSRCRMHRSKQTGLYELLFIEEEPQSQSTYCHELVHLIIWINGAVIKYDYIPPIDQIFHYPPVGDFLYTIWEYMQHVPVFALVKDLDYDETQDYTPVASSLIDCIHQKMCFPIMGAPTYDQIIIQKMCQTGVLVKCLTLPAAMETLGALRKTAKEMIPQSLELADAIISGLGTRTLLDLQEYEEYLSEIYCIAELPRANLKFSFEDKIFPNFRSRILEVANS